jgi:hypothetical protein
MPDWRALDDLDQFGTDTADDMEDLVQDTIHHLDSPFGSNPDAPDRGAGLDNILSGTTSPADVQRAIVGECRKDARITNAEATVDVTDEPQTGDIYDAALEITTSDQAIALALAIGPDGVTVKS